jgi:hypothetical protein
VSGDLLRVGWLVDPGGRRQLRRDRRLAHEPLGVLGVGGVEYGGAGGVQRRRGAVVDGGRGHQPDAGVAVGVVLCRRRHKLLYQSTNVRQWLRACSMSSNRAGNSGRYLSVLKFDSVGVVA